MHRATPSSSSPASSSSSSAHRPPRMRQQLTREQLLKSLEILGPVSAPLPPELPPSPPASRASSPAPSLKRRHDSDSAHGHYKRPRTSSISSAASSRPHHLPPRPTPLLTAKHEPSEDGELKEEPPASSSRAFSPVTFSTNFPARRPRREKPAAAEWDIVFQRSFSNGRKLRYSAYARVAAAHPPSHKEYKALRVQPDPNSSYATNSLLIARLELIDSLLHYVYSIWCKEYGESKPTCHRAGWRTTEDAIQKTERKIMAESRDDRERAFLGLIHMVHGFIHARKLRYNAGRVDYMNQRKLEILSYVHKTAVQRKQAMEREQAMASSNSQETVTGPNMLPSPCTSTSSSSSTPLGGHGAPAPEPSTDNAHLNSSTLFPDDIVTPVNSTFLWQNKAQVIGTRAAADRLGKAQETLNLPVIAKHFPRTFARMINTTLNPTDEHQPDFEDEECELFWPGQAVTGEGLGWVCLMGMSMVREFGREYGYQGVAGAVPRMPGDESMGYTEPAYIPHQ